MIRLGKLWGGAAAPAEVAAENTLAGAAIESYRASLRAIGSAALVAAPGTERAIDLNAGLLSMSNSLETPTCVLLRRVEVQADHMLQKWGAQTAEHLREAADEVKNLLLLLASTAASVGDRDHRYSTELGGLTFELKSIANLDDLKEMRESVVRKASELKSYVDQMAQDSNQMLSQLRSKLSVYEALLMEVEHLAVNDTLTGLSNRLGIERRIEWHVAQHEMFCVVMLDLNRLKCVNDTYGHLAGDDMLKQFGRELERHVRGTDLVGRWGGDEFVVVLASDLAGARLHVEHLKEWIFGEYTIHTGRGDETIRVPITASMGLAPGRPGETIQQTIEEADSAMYREKREHHKRAS